MTRPELTACPKCDGTGYIAGFDHVADGVCFLCAGRKVVEGLTAAEAARYTAPTAAQLEAATAARLAEAAAAQAAADTATARRFDAAVAALDPTLELPIRRLAELDPDDRLIRYLGAAHDAGPRVLAEYLATLPAALFGADEVELALAARDALR